ncbi:MAG: tellurite resistance TerB family protein, partial [Desulfobulbaceae bacterium]
PSAGHSAPPPPPPVPSAHRTATSATTAGQLVPPVSATETGELGTEEIARRMIQVMAAAANADGMMDEREEQAILDRLRGLDISQEERLYLLDELHHPKEVAALVAGISDPATARAMYTLACATIEIDTEAERAWLDRLANGLGLSPAVQKFIEEQNG